MEISYATNIALVSNEDNKVKNIIWGYLYGLTFEGYTCVESGDLAVQVGDDYLNGKFYHEGEEVLSLASQLAQQSRCLNIISGEVTVSD